MPDCRPLVILVSWLALSSAPVHGDVKSGYLGRPLIEALETLQGLGLNLLYSTAVVDRKAVVTVEPTDTEPRAILDQILAALRLEARDGPGGSILIVSGTRPVSGRLRGRVVSDGRGTPVIRASITLLGASAQTTTRPDGTFQIDPVAPGIYPLTIEASGFVGRAVTGVRIAPGGTAELFITMEARPAFVEEVVVTPGRHSVVQQDQAARLSLRREDVVLVPTLGGDVSRIVELLPGVAAADNSAAFNVRGAETEDVALVLDGLEVYEPFHLENLQSPFSFVDSEIVDTIDFLAGGFTADFGDRHGGFVELSTALPAGPARTRIEAGSVNSSASFGTPLASGSLLVSARAWYPEAVRETLEFGTSGLRPRFGDLYAKSSFHLSPKSVISLHALAAYDRLEFVESDGNERLDSENESGYLWLRGLRSWSETLFSETVVSIGRLERLRQGISDPEDVPFTVDDDRSVTFYGLKHDMTWQMSGAHLLRGGLDVRPEQSEYRYATGAPGSPTTVEMEPSGTSMGAYVAYRSALSDRLATEVGLRWDRQTYTDDDQLSPRFNAIGRVGSRSEVRFGIGRFYQSQRLHELLIEDGETAFRPAELSTQAELTFQHRFPGGVQVRLDAYDRRLTDLHPRYENQFNRLELFPETEPDRVLIAPERARLRGTELLLRGVPGRRFSWWTSYTWSEAVDTIDGDELPRSWDQTHTGKFLVAWRWDRGWSISLSGTIHTGWPTTPVTGQLVTLPDGSMEIEPVVGPRNSERFPAYGRLDLKTTRDVALKSSRLRIALEIINLTDRDNVCCVDEALFEPRPDGTIRTEIVPDHWLGITPSFSLLWEF